MSAIQTVQNGVATPAAVASSDILTPAAAAVYLHVPEAVVLAEAIAGRLPGRCIGGEWRFTRRKLRAWVDAGEPAPTRPTVTQWLADNPRVWDEAAEREAEQEIAEMYEFRKSVGLARTGDPE